VSAHVLVPSVSSCRSDHKRRYYTINADGTLGTLFYTTSTDYFSYVRNRSGTCVLRPTVYACADAAVVHIRDQRWRGGDVDTRIPFVKWRRPDQRVRVLRQLRLALHAWPSPLCAYAGFPSLSTTPLRNCWALHSGNAPRTGPTTPRMERARTGAARSRTRCVRLTGSPSRTSPSRTCTTRRRNRPRFRSTRSLLTWWRCSVAAGTVQTASTCAPMSAPPTSPSSGPLTASCCARASQRPRSLTASPRARALQACCAFHPWVSMGMRSSAPFPFSTLTPTAM
jgi:hypothetical protein